VFPAAFEDCVKATKYFLTNAAEFGVDPHRSAVAGNLNRSVAVLSVTGMCIYEQQSLEMQYMDPCCTGSVAPSNTHCSKKDATIFVGKLR